MLCLIITHKKLLFGLGEEDVRLLTLPNSSALSFEGRSPVEVLRTNWAEMVRTYRATTPHKEDAIKVAIAMVEDVDQQLTQELDDFFAQQVSPNVDTVLVDRLVVSYVHGFSSHKLSDTKRFKVLEAMEEHTHIWSLKFGGVTDEIIEQEGAQGILEREQIDHKVIKELGPAKGHEHLLRESLRQLRDAGVSLDMRGQTELAHQLMEKEGGDINIKREVGQVKVDTTLHWESKQWEEIMVTGREVLAQYVGQERINQDQIDQVFVLGAFFKNRQLNAYLKDDLGLAQKLVGINAQTEETISLNILKGLSRRVVMLTEAETKSEAAMERKRQEEKRAKVAAELKAKDERDLLFAEMEETCKSKDDQEKYEQRFVPQGERLGIPAVVIKWNISELLNKVTLEEEAKAVGVMDEPKAETFKVSAPPKPSAPSSSTPPSVSTPPAHKTVPPASKPLVSETPEAKPAVEVKPTNIVQPTKPTPSKPVVEAPKPTPKPVVEAPKPDPKPVDPAPVKERVLEQKPVSSIPPSPPKPAVAAPPKPPVVENKPVATPKVVPASKPAPPKPKPVAEVKPMEAKSNGKSTVATTTVAKPEIKPLREPNKPKKSQKNLVSLDDLFVIQRDLPYKEFNSKLAVFKGQTDQKVVRLIPANKLEEAEERFRKVYQKEQAYYENVSELSHAKEGLFFYRPYIERSTLKEQIIKMGLNKKEQVDDLSSNDLKFILQVFKEVRALEQSHADLNGDNILILTKRKWGLQRNMEVKFVGFTSDDTTNDEMIEATHRAFATGMGENFYQAFREKFQL